MRRKIVDEREARRCLKAAKAAGLSVGAWARAHGIDGRSLNAWRINMTRSRSTGRLAVVTPLPGTPHAVRFFGAGLCLVLGAKASK